MPEIISLLSSSPPPTSYRPNKTASDRVQAHETILSDISFNDSVFDNAFDLDFPLTRSAKRRRLSPKVIPAGDLEAAEAVFDLSSEADFDLPEPVPAAAISVSELHHSDISDGHLSRQIPSREKAQRSLPSNPALVIDILSDDYPVFDDPILTSSQLPKTIKGSVYSEQTAKVLANLKPSSKGSNGTKHTAAHSENAKVQSYAKSSKVNKPSLALKTSARVDDNILDSSQVEAKNRKTFSPSLDDENIATKKQPKKRKTSTEKEAEKEKKSQEKERKAHEKQLAADIAEVNKAKTNKKIAAKEMYVELPNALKGKSIGNQVSEFIKEAEATIEFYEEQVDMADDATVSVGHIIRWKRKVEAEYDSAKEEWIPISSPIIQAEKHVLVYLTAEEFCIIAACGKSSQSSYEHGQPPTETIMQNHLDDYIKSLRTQYPQTTMVILIQGLPAFLKKSVNAKNREFAAAVRAQNHDVGTTDDEPTTTANTTRKKRQLPRPNTIDLSFLTADHSEALQLHLQLHHQPLNIIHTTSPHTSAHQIFTLTQHLATRPYRLAAQQANLAHASFCMDGGQIKTGQGDARETFILMLQEVNRITVSMAHGVLGEGYEGPASLVKAFKKVEERQGRDASKLMLKDVRKAMNRDGAVSDKPLGQMVSRRLWKVFMEKDEGLRDGIV